MERVIPATLMWVTLSIAGSAPAQEQSPSDPQSSVAAADADLAFPPTISTAPGSVEFEAPDEGREPALEIVVVKGRTDWRLPDLGSSLREQRENEIDPNQRIHVNTLPLYTPGERDPNDELFDEDPDLRGVGVGFLQIIRIDIGKRGSLVDRERSD
jgi:hypothetical protein